MSEEAPVVMMSVKQTNIKPLKLPSPVTPKKPEQVLIHTEIHLGVRFHQHLQAHKEINSSAS